VKPWNRWKRVVREQRAAMARTAPVFDAVASRTRISAPRSSRVLEGAAVPIDPGPLMTVVITWSMMMTDVIVKGVRMDRDGWA
jgi:hypothetical protein